MDMDIPLPEELELLESNSHFPEQEEDHHYYFPELHSAETHSQQPPPDLALPPEAQSFAANKRSRPNPPEEEKRAKVRVSVEEDSSAADEVWLRHSPPPAEEKRPEVRVSLEENSSVADEDWLRYSPPPEPAQETTFAKEQTLSRFASEIDGECMPVTAPNGDRVYAKLNRFQGEDRVMKLDCNGYSAVLNVLDEIDGALGDGKGAVEFLLKMISAERKPDAGKQSLGKGQPERKSSKKGSKTASLSRPVICICNDLYAPALRPLRQVAKVHIIVQPTVSRVVNSFINSSLNLNDLCRLTYICNKEGMKASAIALSALAEYTECDIRSCLNTLQFLSKKKEALNVFDIGSQVVGQKDKSKNVLDVWKEIFHKRRTKKMERKSHNGKSFEFDYLYSLVSNRGDSDLILDGIHENILQLSYHDPVMQKTVKCFNNLGVYDLMHQYIMHTQQLPLYVYLPLVGITVHHIVSQVQKPNIEWPKSHQRYRTMMMERMDILNTWHHKIPPFIARHLSASSFVEDLISPLLHILSPPTIRPVALQLLSDNEKNDLAQLVSTMVSYALTYKTMKLDMLPQTLKCEVADGLALSLVPPISDFINFKDYTSNRYVLSLSMKQVLVHEVEKHKILQVTIDKTDKTDKTVALANGGHEVIETGTNSIPSANTNQATAVVMKTNENQVNILARQSNANPTKVSPNLNSDKSARAADSVKLSNVGNMKKPYKSSSSFFDR
uniref:Chromosome transmission fidelity protein 18 isogeny n=1 Tax=Cajanus cajan TaxID=3821 RepID=A0A151S7K6_CAJCA|nr:Chromosome transmission fidelity protein 18 isogeny [Cajanus cajan]